LRVEEGIGGEAGVENAVTRLRDEPAGEQLAEVPFREHDPEVGDI
jgi:hypothetical protein